MDPQPALFGDLFSPKLPSGFIFRANALDLDRQRALLDALSAITRAAPPAKVQTKGGGYTSAAITNCGEAGWWSDPKGYRYERLNPITQKPWPAIPDVFSKAVADVAHGTPWPAFAPDACLINFYEGKAKMGLHQDRDEKDFAHPIVTVCLGDDADFLIGGFARGDKTQNIVVRSGDVLVMGGDSRMRFHGVRKIYPGTSPLAGVNGRYSLTFRKAL